MLNTHIENDIATIELADGKANVFSPAMLQAVNEALDSAEAEAKLVVLKAQGKMFSAGFDLATMSEGDEARWGMVLAGFKLLQRLYAFPLPVVAAINGHALGMGAFALLVSDTRIAAQGDYKIGLPETAGNMQFTDFLVAILHAELNPKFMKPAALQSIPCDPNTAKEAGFVDVVVPSDHLAATVDQACEALKQLPSKQYAHNKLELRQDSLDLLQSRLAKLETLLLG